MIIPEMAKLYEPYTADGGTLEGAIKWLKKTTGCDDAIIEVVVAETFVDLAGGKSFLSPCPCGCERDKAHTHIEHHMGKKCLEMKREVEVAYSQALQKNIQARILSHIQTQNDEFIAENTKPPRPFFDWSKSETVRLYKKIRGK